MRRLTIIAFFWAAPTHASGVQSWVTYQSPEQGVEVVAPMHWTEQSQTTGYRLIAPDARESGATVTISRQSGSLPDLVQLGKRTITTILKEGRLLKEEKTKRNGRFITVLAFSAIDQGQPIKGTMSFLDVGGQVFLVDCEANTPAYVRYGSTFEKITGSLHDYERSGRHSAESGFNIPSSWASHQDNRLKITARAPRDWKAQISKGRFLSKTLPFLTLATSGTAESRPHVMIASRTETPQKIVAWVRDGIKALPKSKIENTNNIAMAGGRQGYVIIFTDREHGVWMAHTLTMISGKKRILLVLCEADFKSFERYNKTLNMIAASVEEINFF